MANVSTTGQSEARDIAERVVGGLLLLGGVYKLSRNLYGFSLLMRNYRKYLHIDTKKKHKLSGLVANPALKEDAILDIFCNASKETFKYHFKEFNEGDKKPNSTYSYLHSCDPFQASTIEDNKKYKMLCKPRYMNSIYMTSSLLQNMKSLEKGINKKPFTAQAYGQLQYSPEEKHLVFKISSLTTCQEETNEIWHLGLTLKSSVQFFLIGIILGMGFCLNNHHKQYYKTLYQSLRQNIKNKSGQRQFQ